MTGGGARGARQDDGSWGGSMRSRAQAQRKTDRVFVIMHVFKYFQRKLPLHRAVWSRGPACSMHNINA